jgi:general secretion pathway protein H
MNLRNTEGFTLAELLVVLAMIALASIFILPSVQGQRTQSALRTASNSIQAGLAEARLHAIRENRESVVVFNQVERHFANGEGKVVATLPPEIRAEFLTAKGASFYGDPAFRFLPDGSATGGKILLQDSGTAIRIDVHWLTGLIKRQESVLKP